MQEMLCELYDPSPNGPEIVLRLFQLFLAELMDCYERELVRGAADGAAGPTALVTGMLGYIDREFAACSLEGMAAEFGLSPNYATALLKRHVGKTFRQLVQERRLVRAAELLRGGATAGAAAHAVGYENMSFFYRKFHDKYGCTPRHTAGKRGADRLRSFGVKKFQLQRCCSARLRKEVSKSAPSPWPGATRRHTRFISNTHERGGTYGIPRGFLLGWRYRRQSV